MIKTMPAQTLLQGARYVPSTSTNIRERFAIEFSKQRERQEWDNWLKEHHLGWPPERVEDEPSF